MSILMTQQKPDNFSWLKWIKGVFDPKTTAKLSAFVAHIGIWILFIWLILTGVSYAKNRFFPKAPAPILASQPIISGTSGGTVTSDSSSKSKSTSVTVFSIFGKNGQ